MRIPKIASSHLSFGVVRRAAAKRAVEMAKGDMNELETIKKVIEEQKNNRLYDIVPVPVDRVYFSNFVVLPHGLTYSPEVPYFGDFAPSIVSAGDIATHNKNKDLAYKLTNPKPKEKTLFEIESRKILDMCED